MATPREIGDELSRLGLDMLVERTYTPGMVRLLDEWGVDAEYPADRVLAVLRRIPWRLTLLLAKEATAREKAAHAFWMSGAFWGLLLGREWAEEEFLGIVKQDGGR